MAGLDLETVEVKVVERVAWITFNRPDALNAWTRQFASELSTRADARRARPRDPRGRADRRRSGVLLGSRSAGRRRVRRRRQARRADAAAPGVQPADPPGPHAPQAGRGGGQRCRRPGIGCSLALACRPDRRGRVGVLPARVREHRSRARRRGVVDPVGPRRATRAPARWRCSPSALPAATGTRVGPRQSRRGRRASCRRGRRARGQARRRTARLVCGDQARPQSERAIPVWPRLLDLEARLQQELIHTSDFVEGVAAFLHKRPAQVQGGVATMNLARILTDSVARDGRARRDQARRRRAHLRSA